MKNNDATITNKVINSFVSQLIAIIFSLVIGAVAAFAGMHFKMNDIEKHMPRMAEDIQNLKESRAGIESRLNAIDRKLDDLTISINKLDDKIDRWRNNR